jgi:Protein of unknown function (DUF1236)
MSSNRFLMSVAAIALIAGAGAANAQGMNRESGGAAMQHGAPSGTAATPAGHDSAQPSGGSSEMKSEQSAPGAAKGQRAEESAPGQKSKGMSSQNETKGNETKGGKDMKAEGHDQKGTTAQSREGQTGNMNAQTKGAADSKSGTAESKSQTTGNAATSATAAPPAEKRTQIVSAIKSEKIQETTNVNFNISVGAVVPSTVRFHPLPSRIVEIYPEWRGYDVILVNGRYIIVRPQTHEIVYIIEG